MRCTGTWLFFLNGKDELLLLLTTFNQTAFRTAFRGVTSRYLQLEQDTAGEVCH